MARSVGFGMKMMVARRPFRLFLTKISVFQKLTYRDALLCASFWAKSHQNTAWRSQNQQNSALLTRNSSILLGVSCT